MPIDPLDTNIWINIGKGRYSHEVYSGISELVKDGKISLIIPQIVIDEWERNKYTTILEAHKTSLHDKLRNAQDLMIYLEDDISTPLKSAINIILRSEKKILDLAKNKIDSIENLFHIPSTTIIQESEILSNEIMVKAIRLALDKKAPFQEANSMADALIIVSVIDYIKKYGLNIRPNSCTFITENYTDFSVNNKERKNELHSDLVEIFNEVNLKYETNIGKVIYRINDSLVSVATIEIIDEQIRQNTFEHMNAIYDTYIDRKNVAKIINADLKKTKMFLTINSSDNPKYIDGYGYDTSSFRPSSP
jgi:hypothetical protein